MKRGAAFVTAIDKFPLITKSVPGFLVNRVLTPYMFGAMLRLEHGEDKERIDEAAKDFGMPMGPIELADTVGPRRLRACRPHPQVLVGRLKARPARRRRQARQEDGRGLLCVEER